MKDQIKTIELGAAWRRVLLLAPVALIALGVWYGARWCVGNTMAEWLPDPGAAEAAARLAPDDPQAHFTLARLRERTFLPEDLPEAERRYAEAARLSPHDYRLFMQLGRVRGLIGDASGGEAALRRAVELAPTYPDPRWHLGNSLLRQGRTGEAFAELRRAGEASPEKFLPQVIELSWRFSDADVPSVLAAVGNTATARGQLMDYLINLKRLDDARQLWEGFDAGQRKLLRAGGEKLLLRFLEAKRFHDVFVMHQELSAVDGTPTASAPERFTNGGFESAVGAPGGTNPFEWQVVPVAGAQMGLDERVRQEGARSLRIAFNAATTLGFRNISQLVTVEPQTRYRLEYYVRTEDLKGEATLAVEVVDAAQPGSVLAAVPPLPTGTSDWRAVALDFTTAPGAQGVTLRVVSPQCPATTCPIFGKVWYDNFNLQRLSSGGGGVNTNERRAGRT